MGLSEKIMDAVRRNDEEMEPKRKSYTELEEKINQLRVARSKGYKNDDEINKLCNQRTALKTEISERAAKAKAELEALCDEEIKRLEALDAPKAEELTEDVKLLNSGIKLTAKELVNLAQKQENKTATMSRLINQYAEEHNIELPTEGKINFVGHGKEINAAWHTKQVGEYFEKWLIDGSAAKNMSKVFEG